MRAARAAALVVALGGCDHLLQLNSITPIVDASIVDGNGDGSSSGCGPSYGKYGMGGAGLLQVCLLSPPIPSLALSGAIETTSCALTVMQDDPAHSLVCVLAAEQITVSGHVTVTGSLPLVLLATQQLRVDAGAVLDVASHRTGSPGAGAMTGPCTLTGISGNTGNGGSGGAGGSFGTAGGAGGAGETGIAVGMPAPTVALSLIRGGCPGGGGGKASAGASGGLGGAGGGAVYLIAGTAITISGAIDASGAGGGNGTTTLMTGQYGGGGAGGGAGGLVGLDSPSVTIPTGAEIYANGGGGGGGASDANSGNPGQDPTAALTAASGGAGITNGGGGGFGFVAGSPTGVGASSKSGGGGGGGAGSIAIFTTGVVALPSTISPAPLVR